MGGVAIVGRRPVLNLLSTRPEPLAAWAVGGGIHFQEFSPEAK